MTITEFLLARIAEDERAAHKLAASDLRPILSLAATVNHPQRILLECAAKRAIVEAHPYGGDENFLGHCCADPTSYLGETMHWDEPCPTLAALATVYADHPDYDPAWR